MPVPSRPTAPTVPPAVPPTAPLTALLTALVTLAVALLVAVALPARPALAAGDDYPYRADTTSSADRWGFTRRQCVSFAAWRLEQRGVRLSNTRQRWGDAAAWDTSAARLGHRVGSRPVVGAVAHWDARERSAYYSPGSARANGTMTAGGYGHVGVVRTVHADGSATVEAYNGTGDRRYGVMRVKAPRYLYIGVRPAA